VLDLTAAQVERIWTAGQRAAARDRVAFVNDVTAAIAVFSREGAEARATYLDALTTAADGQVSDAPRGAVVIDMDDYAANARK